VHRRARRARAPRRADLPDLGSALAEYRTNLEAMIAQMRRFGVQPVFATQPVLWTPDLGAAEQRLLWLGETRGGAYLEVAALADGMRAFNETLRRTCEEHGVLCIDLSGLDGDPTCFFDDCHFTEAGAARVAELIAAGLANR
jgi:lysophospholipase L1-like esterase